MKEMALSLFFIPSSGASRAFSQLWSLDSALFALAAPDLQILDVEKYPLHALYLNYILMTSKLIQILSTIYSPCAPL